MAWWQNNPQHRSGFLPDQAVPAVQTPVCPPGSNQAGASLMPPGSRLSGRCSWPNPSPSVDKTRHDQSRALRPEKTACAGARRENGHLWLSGNRNMIFSWVYNVEMAQKDWISQSGHLAFGQRAPHIIALALIPPSIQRAAFLAWLLPQDGHLDVLTTVQFLTVIKW